MEDTEFELAANKTNFITVVASLYIPAGSQYFTVRI